jgi:uncharacterized protein (DUF983 family)
MLSLIDTIVLMWVAIRLNAPMWVQLLLIVPLSYIVTSFIHGFILGIKHNRHKKR